MADYKRKKIRHIRNPIKDPKPIDDPVNSLILHEENLWTNLTLTYDFTGSLFKIFNNIKCDPPFAAIKFLGWIKVSNKKSSDVFKFLSENPEDETGKIICFLTQDDKMTNSIHITSGINNQTLFTVKTSKSFDVNYYKKIIDGLQIGLTFKSEKQDSINTKLYIKNIPYFNKFIFKDLCLNENDFRAFLTINEFGKASSHHKTENLLVYFNDLHSKKYPSFRFSLSISPKKNDLIISINDKWKNFTTARLDDFKNHIIRLLNLYYEKAPEIEKNIKNLFPLLKLHNSQKHKSFKVWKVIRG